MTSGGWQEDVKQLRSLVEEAEPMLLRSFQNIHQGYPNEACARFLKAREWNVPKAFKMLIDSLNWRIKNGIDKILSKPIVPISLYRDIRDSQLQGLTGYSKAGLPIFAIGVGLSTFDKASVHYYVQSHIQINEYRDRVVLPEATRKQNRYVGTCLKILDMTGLKLSALSQIKLLTNISTVDDLNYPEKTEKYYIVNAPYIFSACWKVVKPLLHERTKKKIQVLSGCGQDELLKIIDYSALPSFCRSDRSGSGSSRHSNSENGDCYSLDHPFHQNLYNYIKEQSKLDVLPAPIKQGSFHVDIPEPGSEEKVIVETIQTTMKSELNKIGDHTSKNGVCHSMNGLAIQ